MREKHIVNKGKWWIWSRGLLYHSSYPQIKKDIIERLKGMWQSGLPINMVVARSIMLAVIQVHAPELLTSFKCSEVCYYTSSEFLSVRTNFNLEICALILWQCAQLVTLQRYTYSCKASHQCRGQVWGVFLVTVWWDPYPFSWSRDTKHMTPMQPGTVS